jgi:predicted RNA-binding protein YlxR (DUF448 family)
LVEGPAPDRMCIVTREVRDAGDLIRFVVAPDGEVVADLRRRLPGRGVHVTASSALVATAERKHLFAKAFDGKVTVAPGLAERVGRLIGDAAVQGIALARKGGTAVFGYSKVEKALAEGHVVALLHAAEASADGISGLASAARRAGTKPDVIRVFAGEQLDLAFGRTNVIHAALLAGPASEHALARIRDLRRYRGEESFPADSANETLILDALSTAPSEDL